MSGTRNKPNSINELKTLELSVSTDQFPVIHARIKELIANNWNIYVVNQSRGVCNRDKKYITIPTWVLSRKNNYWVQYLAHELAHTADHLTAKGIQVHGVEFMEEMKRLCPSELWYHELSYKPESATLAGITQNHNKKDIVEVKLFNILDAF